MEEVKNGGKNEKKPKYNITIISNEPSQQAIENFNKEIACLLNAHFDKHDTIPYNGRNNQAM